MPLKVPFIDLSRIVDQVKDDVIEDWKDCLDHCEFVGGKSVGLFEENLAKKLEVDHAVACSNGTDALMVGLQALGIKSGMKVAVPNMTFWASYEAIVQLGATPVLIDIDLDDLQMSFEELKQAHDKYKLDGAVFVHLYGWGSKNLIEMREFCKKENIKVIEDGAQAYGVKYKDESVFKDAEMATLSFYPAKVLGASGDAGAITVKDKSLNDCVRALCNHGRAGHYTYDYVGWNARLGGLQAKFLNRVIPIIEELLESRRRAEKFYQEFFSKYSDKLTVYKAPEGFESNGYLNVIQLKEKSADEVVAKLKEKGIGCARTYPQTLDMQPHAANALRVSDLEKSRVFSQNVINLPLFAGITPEECDAAARALEHIINN